MQPHAFAAMPFGIKQNLDFDRIYRDLIAPALTRAGFDVFRADQERRAGEIRTAMFQELLLADLVVVDLSIDNPNVWYELGVRHALRSRGVIQIKCRRRYMPFDVYTDRTLTYHVAPCPSGPQDPAQDPAPDRGGAAARRSAAAVYAPDPQYLEQDRAALTEFARETMNASTRRKVSPVYHLLPYLEQPDWKSLRVGPALEFWELYEAWHDRIEVARQCKRPGDIMVLAEEGPTWFLRLDARRAAGEALLRLGQPKLALEQFELALQNDPDDLPSRRQKGVLLNLLQQQEAARNWMVRITEKHPEDAESWTTLGQIERDVWVARWQSQGPDPAKMLKAALDEKVHLSEAITTYTKGFLKDTSHFYCGVHAVTLIHLRAHLTGVPASDKDTDTMMRGIHFAASRYLQEKPRDFRARAALADLALLTGDAQAVKDAFCEAMAVAEEDWFAVDCTRQQLQLLQKLGFRPAEVQAALDIVEREMTRAPGAAWAPRQVFLFSGHRIDEPGQAAPRFLRDKVPAVRAAIARQLDALQAGPEDLGLCGGACGGDLLFAEACLARGMRMEIRIPLPEALFLSRSVSYAGPEWRDLYFQLKALDKTQVFSMRDELGPPPAEATPPFPRNNLWQLYTALARGPDKLRFIALWDGAEGGGPGGTKHLYDEAALRSGRVYVLDIRTL